MAPVRGLRPVRARQIFVEKAPKPRSMSAVDCTYTEALIAVYDFFSSVLHRLQQIGSMASPWAERGGCQMLSSKEGQSIALGIAMLVVWTAATVHVQSRPQEQNLAWRQVDPVLMMSHVRNLPAEAAPIQP
jgi:hypothetical protein